MLYSFYIVIYIDINLYVYNYNIEEIFHIDVNYEKQ